LRFNVTAVNPHGRGEHRPNLSAKPAITG